jgi:putative transposase
MKAVRETIGVARSNVAERAAGRSPKRRGRPPLPDGELLKRIKAAIADMPSYGYARVWAVLRRDGISEDRAPVNCKRVYRVMRAHGLLLSRHAGVADERRHDGEIAVAQSNLRWCSDGFEITSDNAEKVRIAFALDCCDREAVGHIATTKASREKMFATSWSRPSNSASDQSIDCRRRSNG